MQAVFDVNIENFGAIYDFATKIGEKKAVEQCLFFADLNAERIIINKDVFSKLSFELVSELVSRDSFCVREVDLFKALLNWQKSNRTYELYEVLKDLRWNQMSSEEFASDVRPLKIVSDAQYFESFVSKLPARVPPIFDLDKEIENEEASTSQRIKRERDSIEEMLTENDDCSAKRVKVTDVKLETADVPPSDPKIINEDLIMPFLKVLDNVKIASHTVGTSVVESVLKIIEMKLEAKICDEFFLSAWKTMISLVVRQENCQEFLSHSGVQHIIDSLRLFSNNNNLISCLLVVVNVLLEHNVEEFVKPLLTPEILTKVISLTNDPNFIAAYHYVSTYIMLLFTQHRELFITEAPFCDRSALLENLRVIVESWPLERNIHYDVRSMNPMITFAKANEELAFKMFAIWSVAYFTSHDSQRYCEMVSNTVVYEIMNETNSEMLKLLGDKAVFNINEHLKLQMPPLKEKKKKPPKAPKPRKPGTLGAIPLKVDLRKEPNQ